MSVVGGWRVWTAIMNNWSKMYLQIEWNAQHSIQLKMILNIYLCQFVTANSKHVFPETWIWKVHQFCILPFMIRTFPFQTTFCLFSLISSCKKIDINCLIIIIKIRKTHIKRRNRIAFIHLISFGMKNKWTDSFKYSVDFQHFLHLNEVLKKLLLKH